MAARYGRNKRRAAREAIAALEANLREAERRAALAASRLSTAERRGAELVLNDRTRIEACMREISVQLGRALAPEIQPYAERLLAASHSGRPPMRFSAATDPLSTYKYTDISGAIDLRFAVRVAQW